jgi:hypothetical protein
MARVPEAASHEADASGEEEGDAVSLDPAVVAAIGDALMAHYRDLTDAPLPDRFLVMLSELEAKEREHGK